MRLLDPKNQDLGSAIYGAFLLADAQVADGSRIAARDPLLPQVQKMGDAVTAKPAGFVDVHGVGKAGDTVAAVSVAWYTRLNGVKVVQIQYGPAKVTRDGVAETPALVSPGYIDQIVAAGGYPVLASERLAGMFAALLRAKKDNIDVPPEADAVYAAPGDLNAWKALADTLGSSDLLKAIGG
jgi:hypothetical protein